MLFVRVSDNAFVQLSGFRTIDLESVSRSPLAFWIPESHSMAFRLSPLATVHVGAHHERDPRGCLCAR